LTSLPKISIIIPSFNQGKYLEETLLSVIKQEYPNLQLIVIDGGSTDESLSVIKKYQHQIDYWISEKDKGQSHAINKGLEIANGQLTSFLNSDDLLLPNALFEVAHHYVQGKKQIVTGAWLEGPNTQKTTKREVLTPLTIENFILNIGLFGQPGTFWTSNSDLRFNEDYHFCLDFDFFYRLLRNHFEISITTQPLGFFRYQPEAKTTLKQDVKLKEIIGFLENNSKYHRNISNDMQSLAARNTRSLYRLQLLKNWKNSKLDFCSTLWAAIKYDPRVLIRGI
jgi:glycosyltransferase involved in cell wall biosynthesis